MRSCRSHKATWRTLPISAKSIRLGEASAGAWLAEPGEQRRDLLEFMDDRHERGSTIVTSQVPVDHWHEVIGDPTIADAVLDRLVHNAHRLMLKGESLRKRAAKALMLDAEAVN
jgi:hypothetical protein